MVGAVRGPTATAPTGPARVGEGGVLPAVHARAAETLHKATQTRRDKAPSPPPSGPNPCALPLPLGPTSCKHLWEPLPGPPPVSSSVCVPWCQCQVGRTSARTRVQGTQADFLHPLALGADDFPGPAKNLHREVGVFFPWVRLGVAVAAFGLI